MRSIRTQARVEALGPRSRNEGIKEVSQGTGKPRRVFVASVPFATDPSPRVLRDVLLHAKPISRTRQTFHRAPRTI